LGAGGVAGPTALFADGDAEADEHAGSPAPERPGITIGA
jgi:hypothetical protein